MDSAVLPAVRAKRPLRVRLLRTGILLVIFCAGSIAGYCVGTMQLLEQLTQTDSPATKTVKDPDRFTEWLLAQLKKDLSLTEAQYPQVEKIIRRHHEAFNEIRERVQPLFAKEMANMDRDMIAVLDDQQGTLWKARMERMRSWPRSPGGGRDRGHSKKGPPSEHKSPGKSSGSGENLPEMSPDKSLDGVSESRPEKPPADSVPNSKPAE